MSFQTKKTDHGYNTRLVYYVTGVAALIAFLITLSILFTNGFNWDEVQEHIAFTILCVVISVITFGYYKIVIKG